MTRCKMSIEAGARAGMIAPDAKTLAYLHRRPYAPAGAEWDRQSRAWLELRSDDGAPFDRKVRICAARIAPMVSWGTNPAQSVSVHDTVPYPDDAPDAATRDQ